MSRPNIFEELERGTCEDRVPEPERFKNERVSEMRRESAWAVITGISEGIARRSQAGEAIAAFCESITTELPGLHKMFIGDVIKWFNAVHLALAARFEGAGLASRGKGIDAFQDDFYTAYELIEGTVKSISEVFDSESAEDEPIKIGMVAGHLNDLVEAISKLELKAI